MYDVDVHVVPCLDLSGDCLQASTRHPAWKTSAGVWPTEVSQSELAEMYQLTSVGTMRTGDQHPTWIHMLSPSCWWRQPFCLDCMTAAVTDHPPSSVCSVDSCCCASCHLLHIQPVQAGCTCTAMNCSSSACVCDVGHIRNVGLPAIALLRLTSPSSCCVLFKRSSYRRNK